MFTSLWTGRSPESSVAQASDDSSSTQPARGNWVDSRITNAGIVENRPATTPGGDHVPSPRQSTPTRPVENPTVAQHEHRRPRTPRSASAIKDGRQILSAYRKRKAISLASPAGSAPTVDSNSTTTPTTAITTTSTTRGSNLVVTNVGGGIKSLVASPGLATTASERIEREHACTANLAHSLDVPIKNGKAAESRSQPQNVHSGSSDEHNGGCGDDKGDNNHPAISDGSIVCEKEMRRGRSERREGRLSPAAQSSPSAASCSPERPTAQVTVDMAQSGARATAAM